jgi:ParB-like chromosome segregation protein Spo0J/DNA-directed RNA polymerase subunit RPC12/RpoP
MSDAEIDQLAADIKEHGLLETIKTYQGRIIDGKNRFRACQKAGVTPRFEEWDGKGSLVSYVVSLNLSRRHLTADQRAAIAVNILPLLEKEAKERQGTRTDIAENFPQSQMGRSRDQAAKIAGVNPHYVSDFKRIQETRPDLAEKIRKGSMKLVTAVRELKNPPQRQEKSRTAIDEIEFELYQTQLDLLQSGNMTCQECYSGKLKPMGVRWEMSAPWAYYKCAECGWEFTMKDVEEYPFYGQLCELCSSKQEPTASEEITESVKSWVRVAGMIQKPEADFDKAMKLKYPNINVEQALKAANCTRNNGKIALIGESAPIRTSP